MPVWCYQIYLRCVYFALRDSLCSLMSRYRPLATVEDSKKCMESPTFYFVTVDPSFIHFCFWLVSSIWTKQMLSQKADTLLVLYKSILLHCKRQKVKWGKERPLSSVIGREGPSCNCLLDVILYKGINLAGQSCQSPESVKWAWMKEQYVVKSLVNEKKMSRRCHVLCIACV